MRFASVTPSQMLVTAPESSCYCTSNSDWGQGCFCTLFWTLFHHFHFHYRIFRTIRCTPPQLGKKWECVLQSKCSLPGSLGRMGSGGAGFFFSPYFPPLKPGYMLWSGASYSPKNMVPDDPQHPICLFQVHLRRASVYVQLYLGKEKESKHLIHLQRTEQHHCFQIIY